MFNQIWFHFQNLRAEGNHIRIEPLQSYETLAIEQTGTITMLGFPLFLIGLFRDQTTCGDTL